MKVEDDLGIVIGVGGEVVDRVSIGFVSFFFVRISFV